MATGPRTNVPTPPASPPTFGLLATYKPKPSDGRWTNGITYEPEGCVEGATLDPCDPADIGALTKPGEVSWEPYVLSISETCTASSEREDRATRARRLLEMDTERQLGYELWTGTIAQSATMPDTDPAEDWPNTWLANSATLDILTEAGEVTLTHGMACLDQYLADLNGGQEGVIHATPQTIVHWVSLRVVRNDGTHYRSPAGNLVIASPGYPGTNPWGDPVPDDGDIWAYATDAIRVFLGTISVTDNWSSFDRDRNTIRTVATRPALAEWQRCRHAGVRLDMTTCDIGGAS